MASMIQRLAEKHAMSYDEAQIRFANLLAQKLNYDDDIESEDAVSHRTLRGQLLEWIAKRKGKDPELAKSVERDLRPSTKSPDVLHAKHLLDGTSTDL